ncbi:MAG: SAM-dependent methyltransferase, partial [Candidatus Bathyarchaeota archaeon]
MKAVIRASPLYKFLRYCNDSPLDKTILDCGAGGDEPPLRLFLESGYEAVGVEISEDPLDKTRAFSRKHNLR